LIKKVVYGELAVRAAGEEFFQKKGPVRKEHPEEGGHRWGGLRPVGRKKARSRREVAREEGLRGDRLGAD